MSIRKIDTNIGTIPTWGDEDFDVNVHENFTTLKNIIPKINNTVNDIDSAVSTMNGYTTSASNSANDASDSALLAQASANYQGVWSSKGYTVGQSVKGSDGVLYQCDVTHTTAQNPTTTTGYWSVNAPVGAIGNINSPLLDLDLQNSLRMVKGIGSITYTNPSANRSYIDFYGNLKYAGVNEPRFEKNGLLLEGSSTNLNTYSQDASTSYTLQGSTASYNVDLAPDGTTTADRLIENTATNFHYIDKSIELTAGTTYAASRFIMKSSTCTQCKMDFWNTTDDTLAFVEVNIQDGSIVSSSGTVSVIDYGTYLRISVTATPTISSNSNRLFTGNGGQYLGNGTSYVTHWGYQVEALPFASSYIPTTSTTVTRSADICNLPFSGNFNKLDTANFTIYAKFKVSDVIHSSFRAILQSNTAGFMYFNLLRINNNTKNLAYYRSSGGLVKTISLADEVSVAITVNSSNLVNMFVNGTLIGSNTQPLYSDNGITPTILYVGKTSAGGDYLFGNIKTIKTYSKVLTPTEIALLG